MSAGSSLLFDAPGPKGRRRIMIFNIVGVALVLGILAFVLVILADRGQLTAAKWTPFIQAQTWTTFLIPGLIATLKAAAVSVVTANVFGLLFGMGRLSQNRLIRLLSGIIVEFFRAVPVLLMMIFFYFFYSKSGIMHPTDAPFWAVVSALTLYNGSVMAELVRSGVLNLPSGQSEAGLSIGMSTGKVLRTILLPQALVAMMPSMLSQLVVILKDTALGYLITYSELLRSARLVGTSFQNLIPALIVAAVMFIIINYTLTWLAGFVSRRLRSRTAGSTIPLQNADEGLAPGLDPMRTIPADEFGPHGHEERLPGVDETFIHRRDPRQ
ncbi:glutamate transport system permease protein [Ruaniaceae bacterium KH17]|nr:glutamate transport system permease protein [Ruaniaceae bacterium KH17]